MKEQAARGRGRPRKNQDGAKVMKCYTIDSSIAAYVDSLPDGVRSQYVNEALQEKMERDKTH